MNYVDIHLISSFILGGSTSVRSIALHGAFSPDIDVHVSVRMLISVPVDIVVTYVTFSVALFRESLIKQHRTNAVTDNVRHYSSLLRELLMNRDDFELSKEELTVIILYVCMCPL
jgi:hypothetical protein